MAEIITLPPYDVVTKWEVHQVINWLKKVDLNECIPAFEDRGINGSRLLELTEQKLFAYQDLKIKHRRQIAKCVKECKSHSSKITRVVTSVRFLPENENIHPISNGAAENESDSDDWDTDFGDDTETEINTEEVEHLNNNIIKEQFMVESASSEKHCDPNINTLRNKPIPKPPDLPLVSKVSFVSEGLKSVMPKSTIPRPPLRRPLSQPPPPPTMQTSCPEKQQEEYEIPIVSPLGSDINVSKTCLDNFAVSSFITTEVPRLSPKQLSSECCSTETYEVIESPEENYEIVEESKCFQLLEHSFGPISGKPSLPPRIPHTSSISPPPLPQKPQKLQSSIVQKTDVLKPSLPVLKNKDFLENSDSAEVDNGSIMFSSLGVRKYSMPNTLFSTSQITKFSGSDPMVFSSASVSLLAEDSLSRSSSPDKEVPFSVGSSKYLSSSMSSVTADAPKSYSPPPLPPRYVSTFSEDTAQSMATRPLPPVPIIMKDEHVSFTCKQEEIFLQPWFHEIEREKAELKIGNMATNGAFLVRPSKRAGKNNPFTLTVLNDEKVFHLNIRQRLDVTFALGKEKAKEKVFHCVPELISFHQREPIILTTGGKSAGQTILKVFPAK